MARVQYSYRRQGDLPGGPKRLVPYWRAEVKERPGQGFRLRQIKKLVQQEVEKHRSEALAADHLGIPLDTLRAALVEDV